MTVNIRVYPNKLDSSVFEALECEAGLTIHQWLVKSVPAYDQSIDPLFSVLVDGIEIEKEFWPIFVLKSGNLLECFVEPRDPVTVTLVVIAVVSAGVAIYYANQAIPDTYNSTVPKGSPIYSVNAQGNQPRMMGVIPEVFGRHKIYPDYIVPLNRAYSNHEQYLYMMLAAGVGRYQIDPTEIYIGETQVGNYGGDIDYDIFNPSQNITSHPAHKIIYTSREVAGSNGQNGLELVPAGRVKEWLPPDENFIQLQSRNHLSYEKIITIDGNTFALEGTRLSVMGIPDVNAYFEMIGGPEGFPGMYKTVGSDSLLNCSNENVAAGTKIVELNPSTLELINSNNVLPAVSCGTKFNGSYERIDFQWQGPFEVSPATILVDSATLELVFPQGLCILNNDGNPTTHSVTIVVEWRDKDNPPSDGTWNHTTYKYTASTLDARAYTINFNFGAMGNYEVRVARFTPETNDISYKDKCEWVALKSKLVSPSSYADVTTMGIKIKGTNVLASTAENKINLLAKRILPTWNSSGVFGVEEPTDDIAPVVKYLADAQNLPVDMAELKRLHDIWKARGDTFSGVFDNETTAWEALKRVLAVGFAEPTLERGVLVPVRDEKRDSIEFMYTPQNMIKDSWKFSATMFDESEPDGVEVEYMDGSGGTWKSETVMCLLPGELGLNPDKIRAFGITDRNKAYQFGMRKRSEKRYRRVIHKFSTEMDGLNSSYLSYDGIAVEIPHYGKTGEVVGQQGDSLFLSEPVEFAIGAHYILVRKPTGHASGPWQVVQGADEYEVVITDGPLDFTPVFNGSQERPAFTFGNAEEICERVLIKDIKPTGTDRVALTAVNDDDRVYLYDDALAPV